MAQFLLYGSLRNMIDIATMIFRDIKLIKEYVSILNVQFFVLLKWKSNVYYKRVEYILKGVIKWKQ